MARMTGGEALVQSLYREGVRVIFGLPGVQLYGVMAALRDEPRIRFIATRHEQATSFMADGYARAGGEGDFGTAFVVPGPGLLNAASGLSTAYSASSPVLMIAGQIPKGSIGKNIGLLHEVNDQLDAIAPITKWRQRIGEIGRTFQPGRVGGRRRGLGRREIAFSRAHADVRPFHAHLDGVELPVLRARRAIRDEIVGARVSGDPPHSALEIVRVHDRLSVGLARECLQRLAGTVGVRVPIAAALRNVLGIDRVDRNVGPVRRANDRVERRQRLEPAPTLTAREPLADQHDGLARVAQTSQVYGQRVQRGDRHLRASGVEILRTDREGALWFELSEEGVRRVEWRAGEPLAGEWSSGDGEARAAVVSEQRAALARAAPRW